MTQEQLNTLVEMIEALIDIKIERANHPDAAEDTRRQRRDEAIDWAARRLVDNYFGDED